MSAREQIKKEVAKLEEQGKRLCQLLTDENKELETGFRLEYQTWYSKSLRVVERLAPDRYEEFRRYYEPDPKRKDLGYGTYVIQDYLKGVVPNRSRVPNFDSRDQTAWNVFNQLSVFTSIAGRVDSVLDDLEGALLAHIQDDELLAAGNLLTVNVRAAGTLAGVVLEAHLQRVAQNRGVKIPKKTPTVSDLNDPLKQAGVYDMPTWRKISFLGDIRNLCSHKKTDEPSAQQVREMLDGVNWVLKNVV
jgi:hypothetical protein